MTRLNLLLLGVLVAGSVHLVRVAYEARRLFGEVDRAQAEARRLETEHGRLQAERQAQATPLRVEKTARDKLQMRSATPAVAHYVPYAPPYAAERTGQPDNKLASAGHAAQQPAVGATR